MPVTVVHVFWFTDVASERTHLYDKGATSDMYEDTSPSSLDVGDIQNRKSKSLVVSLVHELVERDRDSHVVPFTHELKSPLWSTFSKPLLNYLSIE